MTKDRVMYHPVTPSSLTMIDGDRGNSLHITSHSPTLARPLLSAAKQRFRHISTQPNWLRLSFPRKLYGMSYDQVSRPEDRAWLIPDTHSFGCMFSSLLPANQSSSTLFASDKSTLPHHRAENTALAASLSCPTDISTASSLQHILLFTSSC